MGKNNKEENKENKEKKESDKAVVLKAFIHCEGVNHITIDRENHKIIVKGDVVKDPLKVLERLQKKYNKNVELISPKPKPDNKQKKDPGKNKEQAKVNTVVLKMYVHCEGCASDIKRKIEKMDGVISVELNKETSHVIVRGAVESTKLIEFVKKKLGKHAELIKEDNRRDAKKDVKNNEKGCEQIIMFSYPPQYSTQYLYPNQTFSDENVFACSIM
ncbi:Heavy metal-associated domain, HMA [Sesbania bispinosa]|nr:Heavy metal-associated domain, HMA [Sesbania bispinosa]